MIATYPDRRFQVWEYQVGHGSLLIRSPKGPRVDKNIDLVFVGVDYLAVPHVLSGVILDRGTDEDCSSLAAVLGDVEPDHVYVLEAAGRRHFVVAAACQVSENDDDIFDSPF